jgi:hypothetical protein
MATDYDAPRTKPEDEPEDLELSAAVQTKPIASHTDVDEANFLEDLELPGADLSAEQLSIEVVPIQRDEFTCMSCFLVHHSSQRTSAGSDICRDCA